MNSVGFKENTIKKESPLKRNKTTFQGYFSNAFRSK